MEYMKNNQLPGEAFDAYIPPKFPVDPPIDLESLSLLIEKQPFFGWVE